MVAVSWIECGRNYKGQTYVVESQATGLFWCAMSHTVCIIPSGRLIIEPASELPFSLDGAATIELGASFNESSAHGLLWLCSEGSRRRCGIVPLGTLYKHVAVSLRAAGASLTPSTWKAQSKSSLAFVEVLGK